MEPTEPRSEPSSTDPSPASPAPARTGPARPAALLVVPAALLASALAWLAIESGALTVDPAIGEYNMMGTMIQDATPETRNAAALRTAAQSYAVLGALLGLGLAVAGGLGRGSARATAIAAVVGAVLGAAGAAGLTFALVPLIQNNLNATADGDLLLPMLVHGGIFGAVGAAGGLALGLAAGGGRIGLAARVAVFGLIGAVVGGVLYEVAGAFAFPLAGTSQPLASAAPARGLACGLVGLGTALVALAGLQPARAREAPPAPAA